MSALKQRILGLIRAQGPMSIAQYMQMALLDPFGGYYALRDPFGRDFVTAPEVSQIFGELIGLFFVQAWEDRGRPAPFHLVELGPGRGTLMADMMRAAAKVRPEFAEAARIVLLEASPLLRSVQANTLKDHSPRWVLRLDEVPRDAPLFLIANEFFDALPVRQFVKCADGWRERMLGAQEDALRFVLAPDKAPASLIPEQFRGAGEGAVFEVNASAIALAGEIARRVARSGGAALIVDYGHAESGLGDTFQAVKANAFADPLAEPGEADLTAHVDFAALAQAARDADSLVFGPAPQGEFLEMLGARLRAERLKNAAPARAAEIDAAVERLTSPAQMGTLFKVMALAAPSSPPLPGFPC